jgi:hypothetical protein
MAIIYLNEYETVPPIECPGCSCEYCRALREIFGFTKTPKKIAGNFRATEKSHEIFKSDDFNLFADKLPFTDIRRETGDISTTLHFIIKPPFAESYPISFPLKDGKLDTEKMFGAYCALHNPKCIDYRGK